MTDSKPSSRGLSEDRQVKNVSPLPWWRRLLLRPALRLDEGPAPLDLPSSDCTAILKHLASGETLSNERATPADSLGDGELAELALQVWRLEKRVKKLSPGKERRQFEDSHRRIVKILEDVNVVIDDPVGKPYVDGTTEIEVIAWEPTDESEEQSDSQGPFVKETIKPIVRKGGVWIGRGQVVVGDPSAQ